MRIFFLLIVYFLGINNTYTQTQYTPLALDSALRALPAMDEDTQKVKALNQIAFSYVYHDLSKGVQYGKQALALAIRLGYKKGAGMTLNYLGMNYYSVSDYPNALDYYLKGLKVNEEIGNTETTANITSNIGVIYSTLGNNLKALEFYKKALALEEKENIKVNTSISIAI